MLGISKSQFFQDNSLLDKALGFKVKFHRAKGPYAVVADSYLPIINLTLSEVFALILAVRQPSASGDYILT
jgi:hypothetical protein